VSWDHDALGADLAANLRCERLMVWENVQLGPSGSPRPDVYTIAKSYAHPSPRAYEVKVSVADFRADVTAGKWRSYLNFAESVTFAVPAGLVAVADLPPLTGLTVRGDTGWRTLRRPTAHVVEIPEDALIKLLIDGVEREGQRHRAKTYAEAMEGVDRFCKKFGAEAAVWVKNREEIEGRIRQAEYHAERITEDAQRRAEQTRKDVEKALPEQWARLCDILGLPVTSDDWTVKCAVSKVQEQAEGWAQPRALTDLRRSIASALENADGLIELTKPKPDAEQAAAPGAPA
jgi:hypothetical protein